MPIGLTAFLLAAMVFPQDRSTPSESFDFLGLLLLSPGVATLLYGVSSIPGRGTVADRHVWIPAAIGVVLITGFVVHALYRTDHALIDLRLFKNRVVTLANAATLLFAIAFFGTWVLFPSYLQQELHQTPLQSGVHMIPLGLGAMLTMPLAGTFMDKHGPGKAVLLGITLLGTGMGIFAYGAASQEHYLPTLLAGVAIMGMGMGCTMMPLSGSMVQALASHQIARGSTLISVNQQIAGSIGAALMSVILTNEFNRSENISAANKIAILRQNAARLGLRVDPSAIPRRALASDFMRNVSHDLSHAYCFVFVVAVVLVGLMFIPAAFLPRKPATNVGQIPASG
ncbi:hypothetical protein ATCCBAA256_18630 [Mycobacterium montefiorense]|nr:hypothetical protein ATCCBAA256_18630 [Mycobacterium montefiorense]